MGFIELIAAQRPDWEKMLIDALSPLIEAQLHDGMKKSFKQAQSLGIIGAFDVENPRVKAWAKEYCAKRVTQICDTTEKRLKQVISEGLEQGQSTAEIRRSIVDDPVIGEVSTSARAEMIARTETANAYVNGTRLGCVEANAYAQENGQAPPFMYQVLAANPECCDLCNELDGVLMWKMDETIELVHPNCRCNTLVVVNSSYL